MSARKLGRFAGLVFVLVALAGGTAATATSGQSSATQASASVQAAAQGDIVWV